MAPQRCQRTQSISAFHKHTQTSEIPIPPQVVKINENALKPYSLVWEKECPLMPDTLNRMRPWSQGPTVKKPSSHWIPTSQTQSAIPSASSKEQLQRLRELDGKKEKSERHTLPPFRIALLSINKSKEILPNVGHCCGILWPVEWLAFASCWLFVPRVRNSMKCRVWKRMMNCSEVLCQDSDFV